MILTFLERPAAAKAQTRQPESGLSVLGSDSTQPWSPGAQGMELPGSSQSERNSSKLKLRTWPTRPLRSFDRCSTSLSRSEGFRDVPSPSLADLPARDLISEPSATTSETHRSCLTSSSVGSQTCCLVRFAWSVQQHDLMGPRTLR